MADRPSRISGYWQKLTKRERVILQIALFCGRSVLMYMLP